jgi:hypothetical protein
LNLSRLYAIAQIEYCRNFIFKRHFPIHKLFERSCELGLWRLSADKIASIFGTRLNRRMRGKLATVIDQIEHGHHVFRAYFKNAFLKQYEKVSTFLRNELVSNNLNDFGLRKGLDHLDAVRTTFQAITDRFAGFQAEWLNVHVDFPLLPLLQRLARPITVGAVRYPGLKIHEPRILRLFEVLLHGGRQIGGWTARQIHVLTSFDLSETAYGLNQLRYDLRKLNGHGLIERDGSRYAWAKAKGEGRPFHRIIVNGLTLFPHLDRQARLGELVRDMETVLARYASRIAVTELNEALLHAVDEALAARTDGQLQRQLDLLRVIRRTMLERERRAATHEREQLAGRIGLLERQIREIEALPEDGQEPRALATLKGEQARLQQGVAAGAPAWFLRLQRMPAASSAIDAFSQRPLSRASRPFMGPTLKGSKGSILRIPISFAFQRLSADPPTLVRRWDSFVHRE